MTDIETDTEQEALSPDQLSDKWLPMLDQLARDGEGLSADKLKELCLDMPQLKAFVPSRRESDGSLSDDDTAELRSVVSDELSKETSEEPEE